MNRAQPGEADGESIEARETGGGKSRHEEVVSTPARLKIQHNIWGRCRSVQAFVPRRIALASRRASAHGVRTWRTSRKPVFLLRNRQLPRRSLRLLRAGSSRSPG